MVPRGETSSIGVRIRTARFTAESKAASCTQAMFVREGSQRYSSSAIRSKAASSRPFSTGARLRSAVQLRPQPKAFRTIAKKEADEQGGRTSLERIYDDLEHRHRTVSRACENSKKVFCPS